MSDDRPASATTEPAHRHQCPVCADVWWHQDSECGAAANGWGQWYRCEDCQEG